MLIGRPRRRGRGDGGATAVEFAIVVPVLFLLVIGMLEFAFVMRDYLAVSSSTRVGARIAATGANAGQGTCPGLPII
jgi:Flp pilus assembly protein TadG